MKTLLFLIFSFQLLAVNPNDPQFPNQWMFGRIQAPSAWSITTGGPIKVAIISTGVNSSHPDLAANLVPGWNFLDNNADTTDKGNIGTFLAGTVAALSNNKLGVASVCWGCKVMPLKVSESGNDTADTVASAVVAALAYAKSNGAMIAVIAYPVTGKSVVESAAAAYVAAGGVVFVGAGNDGQLITNIPNSPSMVTMSGSSTMDGIFGYSNTGPHVDLAAPWFTTSTSSGSTYGSNSGTAFAAAYAAGVAALVKTLNPTCSGVALMGLLQDSADDLGTPGVDDRYGWGRLNALRAVTGASACGGGGVPPPDIIAPTVTLTSPANGSSVSGTVTMTATASDNIGVSRVEFKVDGVLRCSDTTAPYTCSWDGIIGTHSLSATAFDAAGNSATDANAVVAVAGCECKP